jgi:NAD(P)H-quinone oxidoreductase subunit 5
VLGGIVGATIKLDRSWSRPTKFYLRFFQDLFAYDFYVDKLYQLTVVWLFGAASRFAAWLDRYIVDGAVNLVGLATIFSGNALKYNVSGQSQFYLLTIIFGMGFLLWSVVSGQWSIVVDYWSSLTGIAVNG